MFFVKTESQSNRWVKCPKNREGYLFRGKLFSQFHWVHNKCHTFSSWKKRWTNFPQWWRFWYLIEGVQLHHFLISTAVMKIGEIFSAQIRIHRTKRISNKKIRRQNLWRGGNFKVSTITNGPPSQRSLEAQVNQAVTPNNKENHFPDQRQGLFKINLQHIYFCGASATSLSLHRRLSFLSLSGL